ncbi:RNA polymerase I associated factor A49-like protein [Rhizoctonia solani]|uniref:RNA polymerase I associated factor A49-like protein n=2 Tax=Rhizoctonia solani TaxID=456999 RepID=A0A8H7H3R7_9AGAM|nr:RNA polymerase I associated factor A49-like protein [Rhizoctonia solani]
MRSAEPRHVINNFSMSSSLKRKRGADQSESAVPTAAKVKVLDPSSTLVGPVLAHFPSVAPPNGTPAHVYRSKYSAPDAALESTSTILVSETPQIEYVSTNQDYAAAGHGYTCQYMVAIHNRKDNTITFRPAPLYDLTRTVKALKNLETQAVSQAQRMQARNALGEAFGTKKAKAAIKAAERNRVDVGAMKDVRDFVVDSVRGGTSALPTKDAVTEMSLSSRLIPTPDLSASTPSDAYPLANVIPPAEFTSISIQPFLAATTPEDRRALLPHRHSIWINGRLRALFANGESVSKSKLKCLIYVSTLFAFRQTASHTLSKATGDPRAALRERLDSATVPDLVFDGLLERFTETARGGRPTVTSQTETKLFTYLLALCLRIDAFSTVILPLANDLKISPVKLTTYFKSLGCKIQGTGDERRAVLTVPLEFPKPRSMTKRGGK